MNMYKKISASIFLLLFLASCKKNESNTTVTEMPVKNSLVEEASLNMRSVIPPGEFETLDWNNAETTILPDANGTQLLVKDRQNPEKKLIYVISGDTKMYQWDGEVHMVVPRMKI